MVRAEGVDTLERVHQLRLEPAVFRRMELGTQTFFVAPRSRGIDMGDHVAFRESCEASQYGYSGRWVVRRVTHVECGGEGSGVELGFVVLGFNHAVENEWTSARLRRRYEAALAAGVHAQTFWHELDRSQAYGAAL